MKTALRVIRAPFLTAAIVPVLLGSTVAWNLGAFHLGYFLLTFIGSVCIQVGLNTSNDYFDHLSGNDEANVELTPFSGGSRVIQEGIVTSQQVLRWSVLFYCIGIAIGLYLAVMRGWVILALGAAGVFLAFFHNAPPVKLYHLWPGAGELAVFLGFGPLIVLGSYYVQTQKLSYEALWASLPIGFLITAVLYINEFPDCTADRAVGRKTLPVVLGRDRAAWGYVALVVAVYVALALGLALRVFPFALLLAFLTIPLAYKGIRGAMRFHSDTMQLIPTNAATIQLHLANGLIMCLGYAAAGLLRP